MSAVLGIDFGTAYLTGAVVKDGLPQLVTDEADVSSIASYIFRGSGGQWLVGDEAKREAKKNNSECLACLKRHIITSDAPKVLVGNKAENLSFVIAKIFRKLKQNAEILLEEPISEAILVMPERLQYRQQQFAVKAAREAGMKVKAVISDGMAALATYAWEMGTTENVLVCDFGAGIVSVTLGGVAEGKVETIHVNRELFFGGRDFDREIVQRLAGECLASGADIYGKKGGEEILYDAAETARQTLSAGENIAVIAVDLPGKRTSHKIHFERSFKSEELLEATRGYRERILELLNGVKRDVSIDRIILTGGLSAMPMVTECIEKVFGETSQVVYRVREASAMGAALMESEHLPPPEGYGLADLVDELPPRETPYKILVTATMSAGKSTFINALIGERVSKTENLACTDKILTFINDHDGENKPPESDNTYHAKFKGLFAKINIILKDSPGVNSSMNPQHRKITEAEIRAC